MTWAETVARPDGSTYRARIPPRVETFGGYGCGPSDPSGLVVTRTHDVDVATVLAAPVWASEHGDYLPAAVRRWIRFVPWSSDSAYDASWIDVEPRERGAIPVVEFRVTEP